jgi:pSer/pThr/pTyr-binding forkhead associated (FHA) protein
MPYLQYNDHGTKKFFQLTPGTMYIIGRGEHCEFQLLDSEVSREHFAVTGDDATHFTLIDLGARNHTWHNSKILNNETALLRHNDIIIAAGHRFIYLEVLPAKTTQDILNELADEMDEGKGFRTAMLEIITENNPKH